MDGMRADDFVVIDKEGNVYPLAPELWRTLSLDDIRRTDETENQPLLSVSSYGLQSAGETTELSP